MAGISPMQDRAAAQSFLKYSTANALRKGQHYHARGAVRALRCLEPGTCYEADVQGSELYSTILTYEDGEWMADCTCLLTSGCKHGVAAMLALLGQTEASPQPAVVGFSGPPAAMKMTPPTVLPQVTTLEQRLSSVLPRKLTKEESQYLRTVQNLFAVCQRSRGISLFDLQSLAPRLRGHSWDFIKLWPSQPRDEVQFWQYLAFALDERGAPIPEFLQPITDLDRTRQLVGLARRQQQIDQWRQHLQRQGDSPAAPVSSAPVDLRLMIARDKVTLEWRTAEAPFQLLKPSRFKQLAQEYAEGRREILPAAFPLWHALFVRWNFQRYSSLDLNNQDLQQALHALLRLPGLEPRIVSPAGAPFARPTEVLRCELMPPASEDGDYQLRLVTPDGSPVPSLLLTVPGRPALYVTESAIIPGPPLVDEMYDHATSVAIPAPALESPEGLRYLSHHGIELPPRLARQVERVVMKVKVFCDLAPIYPGSETEAAFIRIVTDSEAQSPAEHFTPSGWQPASPGPRPPPQPPAGKVRIFDSTALADVPRLLEPLGAAWEYHDQHWRVRLSKKFADTFVAWLASLPPHVEVLLDKQLATLRAAPVTASVRLDCEPSGVDWFDLKVVLNVTDTELTADELKVLLAARGGYVRLGRKGWRRLQFKLTEQDDEGLARLGLNPRDFTAEPQRLHALQLADEAATKLLPEARVAEVRRRAEEIKTRVAPPVPKTVHAQLRPYQIEGFHFLAYLGANRFGGILADDMGLGKTLQTLTWLTWLRSGRNGADGPATAATGHRPSLVVCPKSVMDNWRAEAKRFAPGLRVHLWRGTGAATLPDKAAAADLLVLNYTQLRTLGDALTKTNWLAAILDEGQYIKNADSQTARAARALTADHRLVLTGTPIENRLLDLWSLMAFAMPGVLGNRAQFARGFDQADDPLARRRLAARVRPFLLRRTKAQVAKELPDRVEEDLFCEMDGDQQTLYRAEFKHAQQMLLNVATKADFARQRFNFLTSLLRLRQICCHPALVDPKKAGADSAKLNALIDLVEPLMEEGHKVLVFSQFVTMLDLLRPLVKEKSWPHFVLTGATENRGELVAQFQGAPGAAVFLVSLKAGGFGLNLTAASYVVLFDPWWNPAVEAQAIDRTHRIGQTRKVIAYRLLIKNSIEEKIRLLQHRKHALAEDVLGEENFAKALTLDDLRFLFAAESPAM